MLLTQSGAMLGTAPYMAPEQIEKPTSVDHRADIKKLKVVTKKDTMVVAIPTESPETVLNVLLQAGDEIVIPE